MRSIQTIVLTGLLLFSRQSFADTDKNPPSPSCNFSALSTASPSQIRAFFNSAEYTDAHHTDAEFIQHLYRAILRREPDVKGSNDWRAALRNNAADPNRRTKAVEAFLKSPEYSGSHPAGTAVAVVPKKDTSRNPANVLFDETGVFINAASAFPADRYAALLHKARVKWISLQIDNGGTGREDNIAYIEAGWAEKWRKEGFKVGYWGCPRGVTRHDDQAAVDVAIPLVRNDAALAVKLMVTYRGEFYIANCEAGYQSFSPKDPAPALSRVYVDAFRLAADKAAIGKLPRALSSMGRIALDMKPWIDGGWDALPQGYWNSYAVYQPSLCVDFYVTEAGWPIERIHPTIATYPGEGEKRTVTLQEYADDLKKRNTVGFSYYLPESYLLFDESAYEQLARMSVR